MLLPTAPAGESPRSGGRLRRPLAVLRAAGGRLPGLRPALPAWTLGASGSLAPHSVWSERGLDERHWDNIDRKGIKMHALNFICCCCLVTQPCWTLLQPTGYSPPGSSVHGVFQARVLSGLPLPYSRGSSRLGAQTCVSCLAGGFITTQPPGKFHLESLTRPFVGIIKKRR